MKYSNYSEDEWNVIWEVVENWVVQNDVCNIGDEDDVSRQLSSDKFIRISFF